MSADGTEECEQLSGIAGSVAQPEGCHLLQIINDTLPALVKLRESGKVCTPPNFAHAYVTPSLRALS